MWYGFVWEVVLRVYDRLVSGRFTWNVAAFWSSGTNSASFFLFSVLMSLNNVFSLFV